MSSHKLALYDSISMLSLVPWTRQTGLALVRRDRSEAKAAGVYRLIVQILYMLLRICMRNTRKVSQGEGFFLSAKDQPFQARYMVVAV